MQSAQKFKEQLNSFRQHPVWQKLRPYMKKGFIAAVALLIIWQLWQIGWVEVLKSLPSQPLFYILFVIMYLSLPVAELLIYRGLWQLPAKSLLKASITKRVYNEEVVGYSGEVYLGVWAKKQTGKTQAEVARNVRDSNILSAANSYFMMLIMLGLLLTFNVIPPTLLLPETTWVIWSVIGLVTASALFLGIRFRQYYFQLPLRQAMRIFSIYAVRFVVQHALLVLQWSVVIPETPITVWLTYLALIILVNRLPFVPSKDLVFLWAGIGMAAFLDVPAAGIAAIFLVSSALNKLVNFSLYLLFTSQQHPKQPGAEKKDRR